MEYRGGSKRLFKGKRDERGNFFIKRGKQNGQGGEGRFVAAKRRKKGRKLIRWRGEGRFNFFGKRRGKKKNSEKRGGKFYFG